MKMLFKLIAASVITLQGCNEAGAHEEVTLSLAPEYSGGTLYVSPVVTYEGEEEAVFQFGHSIARIVEIREEDELLFEGEEEDVDVDQQTTMEEDDERTGYTVELDVEPGIYTIKAEAEYHIVTAENELEKYRHELQQKVEVQSER
ncbi:hypothetical protein [Alkalicoccus daliensis]|uniref:YtkA-like domain-containing protein n=1 Tax=Alkalicoccus daliensis TaxID=745820 RepID=A0A1H0INM4_9BACI|nr:hypothetical protein [Alkalicoccus daliensis]SDO32988.1 hypothetical protein SAMN04488053_11142 [Alkalicoccus daliensis]